MRRVETPRELERFVRFPWRIYANDKRWVAPLIGMQRDKLDAAKNPYWQRATRALFIASRGGDVVGTIAAIVDRERPASQSNAGMFGFFECTDDPEVARALIDTASSELRTHGLARMIGPYNPSAADEYGILVDGFDTRPALIEAHSPRYYPSLMEAAGMEKYHDAYAWLVRTKPGQTQAADSLPSRLSDVAKAIGRNGTVTTRPLNLARWDDEVRLVCELFNASLATVPDFVPVSVAEFRALAESFRPFVDPELIRFVERDGKPVAFALAVPDINEALQVANGRLFPFGALKIWWKQRHLTRASFKILCVLPKYRHRGYDAVLVLDVAQKILERGYTEVDLSMTGEENTKINGYLMALGLDIYRRYRIYSRAL